MICMPTFITSDGGDTDLHPILTLPFLQLHSSLQHAKLVEGSALLVVESQSSKFVSQVD